ncbi:MAG: GNAT family N-acetyltransferase [Polyangia bacterium]
MLKVWFPGLFRREGAPKFFYADPAEASRVTRELIEAFVEHARSVGASFVALSHCPTSDRVVANVAEALAFRTLAAPDAFIIQLAEPTSFEAYLNRLSQTRRGDFRRDLRRAAKAGAHMIEETVARPETLERSWPLHVALSMRKGNDYRLGGTSLFDAFQRWLKPADLRVEACYSGDEFAGALIMHIAGTEMHAGYICHRPELEWQVYTAIIATAIERAISRGTTAVHLGFGNDYQKTRLGADALPHVSYVLPLTRR